MPIEIRLGSVGSSAIEWSPSPPAPGLHSCSVAWARNEGTCVQVMPRSSLRKSPAGSVPAHTTLGCEAWPASMCHVRLNVSAGSSNAGFCAVFHVLPRSRLTSMRGPPKAEFTAA